MKWTQAIQQQFSQHKYAINAKILGDDAPYAWTNLGYWTATTQSYPQACRQLADRLAHAVALNSNDQLLDLGCGRGASVLHWQNNYKIENISAVDLQPQCIADLEKNLNSNIQFHCASFLNLKNRLTKTDFDVVLCIDAAYHSPLSAFLDSIHFVLNSKGRLGFHYLTWSDQWQNLSRLEQKKYAYLLKAANVQAQQLFTNAQTADILKTCGFGQIEIQDISEQVLHGFAQYAAQRKWQYSAAYAIDLLKIRMTAKLCEKLFKDGLVHYVQITAQKI